MNFIVRDKNFEISLVGMSGDFITVTQNDSWLLDAMNVILSCFSDYTINNDDDPDPYFIDRPREDIINECQDELFLWMCTLSAFDFLQHVISKGELDYIVRATNAIRTYFPIPLCDKQIHQLRVQAVELHYRKKYFELFPRSDTDVMPGPNGNSVILVWTMHTQDDQHVIQFKFQVDVNCGEEILLKNLAMKSVIGNLNKNDNVTDLLIPSTLKPDMEHMKRNSDKLKLFLESN